MRSLFLLVLPLLLIAYMGGKDNKTKNAEVPSVKLKTLEGKEIDIRELTSNGKITVISFWATWCTPCKKELQNMNELVDDWREDYDVQIIAISVDDSRNSMKVKPYVDGKAWDFTVLLDENSDSKRAFNWSSIPHTVLIDQNGKIVYTHIGYAEGDEYDLEDKIKKLKEG